MATTQATTVSTKIGKHLRKTITQKFLCECGKEIKMIMVMKNHKVKMIGRCVGTEKEPGCGQEGRSPKYMKLKKEEIKILKGS